MKTFAVFSGFLGSGKTTTMMALTTHDQNTSMISNDLGGKGLADNKLAQLAGCRASELTGDCICYMTETLVERLDSLFHDGCQLVISDIPGFGVGALEHVYHTLNEKYNGRYRLAPFTVLTEPYVVETLQNGGGDLGYILDTQLREADLIVLNKIDLISDTQKEQILSWLEETYPQAQRVAVSALTGEGIAQLHKLLMEHEASLHHPDIGYGGPAFAGAMGQMSEYYIQYHTVVCCNDFDGNAYLEAIGKGVQEQIREHGYEIPHLKLLAWDPEGGYAKLDLIGTDREIQCVHRLAKNVTELAAVLNASAKCPAGLLDQIITGAVEKVSIEFQLENAIFKKECFGMGGN